MVLLLEYYNSTAKLNLGCGTIIRAVLLIQDFRVWCFIVVTFNWKYLNSYPIGPALLWWLADCFDESMEVRN